MAILFIRTSRDNYRCFSQERERERERTQRPDAFFAENGAVLSPIVQERSAAELTCSYLERRALSAGHAIEVHSSTIAYRNALCSSSPLALLARSGNSKTLISM
jgi:hypothetical protein